MRKESEMGVSTSIREFSVEEKMFAEERDRIFLKLDSESFDTALDDIEQSPYKERFLEHEWIVRVFERAVRELVERAAYYGGSKGDYNFQLVEKIIHVFGFQSEFIGRNDTQDGFSNSFEQLVERCEDPTEVFPMFFRIAGWSRERQQNEFRKAVLNGRLLTGETNYYIDRLTSAFDVLQIDVELFADLPAQECIEKCASGLASKGYYADVDILLSRFDPKGLILASPGFRKVFSDGVGLASDLGEQLVAFEKFLVTHRLEVDSIADVLKDRLMSVFSERQRFEKGDVEPLFRVCRLVGIEAEQVRDKIKRKAELFFFQLSSGDAYLNSDRQFLEGQMEIFGIDTSEVARMAADHLVYQLAEGRSEARSPRFLAITSAFNVQEQAMRMAAFRKITQMCERSESMPMNAMALCVKKILSGVALSSQELQPIVKRALVAKLQGGGSDTAIATLRVLPDVCGITEDIFSSSEIIAAAEDGVMACLKRAKLAEADDLIYEYSLPEDLLTSPRARQIIVETGIPEALVCNWDSRVKELMELAGLSEDERKEAGGRAFERALMEKKGNQAKRIKNEFGLSPESVADGVVHVVEKGCQEENLYAAYACAEEYALPAQEFCRIFLQTFDDGIRIQLQKLLPLWLQRCGESKTNLLYALSALRTALAARPFLIRELLDPTVKSQGIGAFQFFQAYAELDKVGAIADLSDIDILKKVVLSQGVRAIDTIQFIVQGVSLPIADDGSEDDWSDEESGSGTVDRYAHKNYLKRPLSANGATLESFLDRFPAVGEIYWRYQRIEEDESLPVRLKSLKKRELELQLADYSERIRTGEITTSGVADPIYLGMLYRRMPPATTISRRVYQRLLMQREDLSQDVPRAWDELQEARVELKTGGYQLKKGLVVNEQPFVAAGKAIQEENSKKIVTSSTSQEEVPLSRDDIYFSDADRVKLATELLAMSKGKISEQDRQKKFVELYDVYRFQEDAILDIDVKERQGQVALVEFIEDRLPNIIDDMLREKEKLDPQGYEKEVQKLFQGELNEKQKKGLMRQLFNLITTPSLDAATTDQRLKQLLEHNGIQIEGSIVQEVVYHLADLLEVTWDKGENDEITREAEQRIKDWLMVLLEQGAGPKQTGKIGKFISNRMFGGMCGAMKLELAKYEFATSVEGKEVGLTFSISKRRGHAIAGLNSGVCVSLDNQLWAKKTFTNVILWNDEISAEGGMHFETIVDNGKKYLSLPGINPSHKILQRVNPDDLYKEMIEYAKKAAEAIGAAGVLIPISKGIHSNRQAIQEIVARQNYPRYRLKMEHDFSYDPYPYSWQEAYFIPVESEFLSMGEEAGDEYEDIQSSFEPRGRRGSSNGATPRAQEIAQENGYFQVKLDKFKTPRLGHRLGDLLGKKETRS